MYRMLSAALAVATLAGVSAPVHADGTRISIAPFQSRQAWQANWDSLNQRGTAVGAQWECHGDHECNLYFIVKPGVKAHLATERYGRGYCYIVEGDPTADCYREDGRKTVWTLDKPFDYGLAPQSAPALAPTYVAPAPAPQYVASPAPQTPYVASPQQAGLTAVALTTPDNWYSQFTTISVNNKWVKVQVDTGAFGMTMTQSLADAMVNNGDATRGEDSDVGGFDGAKHTMHHIIIHTLTFGGRDIADVDAVVVPDSGNPLLGMDILRRFGKFTIDTAASQLILG